MKLLIGLLLLTLSAVVFVQNRFPHKSATEGVTFKFNEAKPTLTAEGLQLVSFGYPRLLSNLLWLRFLQATPTEKVPRDELSWIYFDLDTITTIDPDFYPAFEHAGIFLSVVTEDKKGAELLFLKGVRHFPERWRIFAYLGYHYTYELEDFATGANYYEKGSKLKGAPDVLGMLAARGRAKNSIPDAIRFLEELRDSTSDPVTRKNFESRIKMWKEKLAKEGQKK